MGGIYTSTKFLTVDLSSTLDQQTVLIFCLIFVNTNIIFHKIKQSKLMSRLKRAFIKLLTATKNLQVVTAGQV